MSFQRWKVVSYKKLQGSELSEENKVSLIIDHSLRELVVYANGMRREVVKFPNDSEDYPKMKIRGLNLYVMLNSKLDGFRVTFQSENLTGITKSVESFQKCVEDNPRGVSNLNKFSENLSETQCSSPFSLPSVKAYNVAKTVQFSQDLSTPSPQKVDKSVQTEDLSEELLENDEFVLSCMKVLMENEDFGNVLRNVRGQMKQMDDEEFDELEQETNPDDTFAFPSSKCPPPLEHETSDQDFDRFFAESNI